MCGIAGMVSFDEGFTGANGVDPMTLVTEARLRAMAAHIAHRGPDGEGIKVMPGRRAVCGMAFRRLAVLDCDARAMQPMTTPDARFTLVFNGEIYNYRELKTRLPPRDWRTSGDAEVLLHALAEWGVEATLPRLNGMFAFGLWDARERQLTLARDRLGQKPLYVASSGLNLAFASEVAALYEWPCIDPRLDDRSLSHYLRYGYVQQGFSMGRDIGQVLPGTSLVANKDSSRSGREWFDAARLLDVPPDHCRRTEPPPTSTPPAPPPPAPVGVGDVRRAVETAVRRQLVSDVPLGVFLSGGIDSSVIALCARAAGPVRTFSIGFDDPRYDETPYAEAVAKQLGTEHHTFRVTPQVIETMAADLPRLAEVFGEPFADSSALPTHWLSRQTRKHVTVALSGDGGDELFGGYDRYRAVGLPRVWLPGLAAVGGRLAQGHPKSRLTRLGRLLAAAALPAADRYDLYVSLFDPDGESELSRRDGENDLFFGETQTRRYRREEFGSLAAERGPVAAALAFDRATYLPGDLLTKVDRCSMLHGLEVRSPFFDPDVLALAGRLRKRDLLVGGPKRMLREAFAVDLPDFVFRRKKMGFAVPIGQWLRGPLRAMLHDHLFAADAFAARFRPGAVRRLVEDHECSRRDHGQRLYALLMLELWWRRFGVPSPGTPGEG